MLIVQVVLGYVMCEYAICRYENLSIYNGLSHVSVDDVIYLFIENKYNLKLITNQIDKVNAIMV